MPIPRTVPNAAFSALIRGAVGFICGFIVAEFVLVFLGVSHGHWDLSATELEQEYRALRIALWISVAVSGLSVLAGGIRVPRFLITFVVVFGAICVLPFWPNPKSGGLAPFGTPYVNWGYCDRDAELLACHVALTLLVTGLIHGARAFLSRRRRHMT
jgi:hypothetical protein